MTCRSLIAILLIASASAPAQERGAEGAALGVGAVQAALAAKARDFIELRGNTSFSEEELVAAVAEQLREIQEQGMTPARADDAAFYVGAFYRKKGFAKATVDHEIRGRKVVVRINEGPRALLKKVTFIGNHAIPEATLYDYMIGATPERLAREPAQFPYTEAEVAAGADRVRGLYLSEGYLNVKVDSTGIVLSENGTRASLTVRIDEGLRFTFGEIRFAGNTVFPREELVAALGDPITGTAAKADDMRHRKRRPAESETLPYKDVSFSPGRANAMQRNLQSFYKGRGYFQAEVALDADYTKAGNGLVPVTFTAQPDGLFRFGGVALKSESAKPRMSPRFLPTRFAVLKGEVYDPEKLDETYREMLRTGLFSTLRVSTVAQPGNEVMLEITAEEAKAKEVGFTLGYSSYEGGIAGLRLGDRNLFGRGRPLTFAFDYSQRGMRGELLYVDPWLFDTRFALRSKLYSVSREELGYSKSEVGGRLDLTRRIMPHLELGVFVEHANVKVTDVEPALAADPQRLGPTDYAITSLGVTQLSDYRDNPLNPSRGLVVSSSFDYALLDGAPGFTRSTFRFSYYLPLGKTLLAFGARAGYIAPIVDAVPIDVRFFNGGSTTVRSFAERELGPKDKSSNPLGGDFYTVLNLEYTFPLYQALQGAVFVDAGSLRNMNEDDRAEASDPDGGSGDLRYAIGLGLRYKLPIGPLRLDYGVNPNPKPNEDFGAFHFSFGFAF
ncbi:MAG: outer membrane protein insertion porin family [Chthoniobacter sp.]|nr:outer membrane protein insertion porin family [Chthoniobacter sp.]